MYHQIYKDEFLKIRRQLIERNPGAARTYIDYENPGNLGGVTGVCFDLDDLFKAYVQQLVAIGKIKVENH